MRTLVTGGGGFLGSRLARMLAERGDEVIVLGRNRYPALEALDIRCIQTDIRDALAVRDACAGVDVVFHVAALAGIWGPRDLYEQINVRGTWNVINACRDHGVPRLVYTSSPSVVLGEAPVRGGDESLPYPRGYLNPYSLTKALAERDVLRANGPLLRTVAIRPHLIFGPGDPHLLPRIVARARTGRLICVGTGDNLVDITYVDNAARAHILAADELAASGRCAGKAYFISQGQPVRLWAWISDVLARIGAPGVRRRVSHRLAWLTGAVMEAAYALLRLPGEPPMTRFLADQLAHDHFFDISAARRDFGYEPHIGLSEATDRLVAWLKKAGI